MFEAAALGYADRLAEELETGGRAQAVSADGFTALHLAAYFGKAEAARRLLDAGAEVDAVSQNDDARPAAPQCRSRAAITRSAGCC